MSEINPKKRAFISGMRDGLPIALGYFAVSFSLGIQAKDAGMSVLQAAVMSLTSLTSAGEFAALSIIATGGSYISMALSQLIINLRYILMSFALSQRIAPETSSLHRTCMSYGVTDEIFGISVKQPKPLSPFYTYGALLLAVPGWVAGTALGVAAGNILPDNIVSALNLALYGMFIAVFIPQSREDKHVAFAVLASMIISTACAFIPFIKDIRKASPGTMIIILTVLISLVFAILFPIKENDDVSQDSAEK
ncbi:MAG: AzlC family ABC transporter permease [Lachnospiraceae bacterium]|nr:AzlC family ABC transporter permease [Lachnospiraceae bacterium]